MWSGDCEQRHGAVGAGHGAAGAGAAPRLPPSPPRDWLPLTEPPRAGTTCRNTTFRKLCTTETVSRVELELVDPDLHGSAVRKTCWIRNPIIHADPDTGKKKCRK